MMTMIMMMIIIIIVDRNIRIFVICALSLALVEGERVKIQDLCENKKLSENRGQRENIELSENRKLSENMQVLMPRRVL